MKRITIIGHFGFNANLLNGQTIKTKIIASELEKKYGTKAIKRIDTRGGLFKRFFSFLLTCFAFLKSTDIIFMPAKNGLKTLAPLLTVVNKIFKRRLHYITIGGWLYDYACANKKIMKSLEKINFIYVETNYVLRQLSTIGLNNLVLMPNCKRLSILDERSLSINDSGTFHLCTFSRVSKEKGIEDAIKAVEIVNRQCNKKMFFLDIFGRVATEEKEWFSELTKSFSKSIAYKGEVDFDKTTEILSSYDLLLFPSFYDGEGFAGTIIDAFSAGLPVIASDWKSNPDIISDKTGRVFETRNVEKMANAIIELTKDYVLLLNMRRNCIQEAKKYGINCVMEILYNNILYKKEV